MDTVVHQSREILATHARSFRWASWFLPSDRRDDAAVVYAWCRLVDDAVDEAASSDEAADAVAELRGELLGERAPRPIPAAFLAVCARRGISVAPALELLEGCRSDLGTVRFADDRELLRYCYRVAGTVGLLMCGVLGVTDPRGAAHAVDLGVGMQLTNICRDVLEDAKRGRTYLPADRLAVAGSSPEALLAGEADPAHIARVVRDLLAMAEEYYRSGDGGMQFIPARSRVAILVAARVYRAIGGALLRRGGDALAGRAWVGIGGKVLHTGAALVAFARLAMWSPQVHDAHLHEPLAGLPGCKPSR
ncbi:MAG: phytoene synthase [Myxococcota bacterium]|jgi:phytoene synthase